MIEVFVLLPGAIALVMLFFMSPAEVLLKIYLPCLMFVPLYLYFAMYGVAIDPCSLIGISLAFEGLRRWGSTVKLSLLDVCVLLNVLSLFYADAHNGRASEGLYAGIQGLLTFTCPYLIGRTIVEQTGSRTKFAKIFVSCLVLVSLASIYETLAQKNLFQNAVETIRRQGSGWLRQARWGFGRIAGPYAHAIFAGMMFSVGLMLQIWLMASAKWLGPEPGSRGRLGFAGSFSSPQLLLAGVLLGLLMTLSRGPWIGCGFGLILFAAGFGRKRKRSAVIAGVTLAIGLIVSAIVLDKYTDAGNAHAPTDQDQQNAAYRRGLIETYRPLIAIGGLWGWGSPRPLPDGSVGWVARQPSIDNEYLRRAMQQGYVGTGLLVVMFLLSGRRIVSLCRSLESREDFLFAYCLLGMVGALAFTLSTVALASPVSQTLFLILGWAESVRPTSRVKTVVRTTQPYVFEQVFV